MTYCGIRGNVWLLKVVITRTYVIIIVTGAINHRGTIDDPLGGGTLLRHGASARFLMNLHDWRASLSRDRFVGDRLRLPALFSLLIQRATSQLPATTLIGGLMPPRIRSTLGKARYGRPIINATFGINKRPRYASRYRAARVNIQFHSPRRAN